MEGGREVVAHHERITRALGTDQEVSPVLLLNNIRKI